MGPLPGSHLVAHGRALWKLTAPWTHRTRPPCLGKRCAFSTSSHRAFKSERPQKLALGNPAFQSNHPRKTPKGPKMALGNPDRPIFMAISEFPKGRKCLISLSFLGKSSVRPAQVGRFDVNIVIHGSTAVRGRGDLVAYGWALWKLPAPWPHRTRPPHLGKRCAFSTSFHRAFPIKSSTKNPERPQNSVGKPG